MKSAQYCRKKTISSNSSFFLTFFFLDSQRRSALYALYAFCREVDDIVDTGLPKKEAQNRLDIWRQELRYAFVGQANHPVSAELAKYQRHFSLSTKPFYTILDGMEMDLEHDRYPTLDMLEIYCHKVAVAVGLVAIEIFAHDPAKKQDTPELYRLFAQHLGMAFQLTNILRDVAEDARMGRIYLPQQLLANHGASEADILHNRWTSSLAEAMCQLGEVAQQHYQEADALISTPEERQRLLPAFLMSGLYRSYLERLRHNHFGSLEPLPSFSILNKAGILWRTWWQEKTHSFHPEHPIEP